MSIFLTPKPSQNAPWTLPEPLWTPKWPCDPSWCLSGRLLTPQSRPKSTGDAKGTPRPTKVAPWRHSGHLQWPFRLPKPPQDLPKAPQSRHFPPKSDMFTQNRQLSLKIFKFLLYFVHRRPAYVQRTSPNMGRRQCYAHRYNNIIIY